MKATRLSLWEQNSEIREVFTLWLEALEARGIAPRTLENYREGVGQFMAFLEPHATTLDAVQPAHIRKWLLHKQRKGVSPYTVRNAYRLPRLFWRWCLREELTANDPFQKVEKPKQPSSCDAPDAVAQILPYPYECQTTQGQEVYPPAPADGLGIPQVQSAVSPKKASTGISPICAARRNAFTRLLTFSFS